MKTPRGMSLVDVLVGAFLVLVVFVGLFALIRVAVQMTSAAKAKSGAISVLSSAMERIRTLPYAEVGTLSGDPEGVLSENETVTVGGIEYVVQTSVSHVDDGADGTDSEDDGVPEDYKRVVVEVSYGVGEKMRSLTLSSVVAPPGSADSFVGGALAVRVVDMLGVPVSGATVTVESVDAPLEVPVVALSGVDGRVLLSGLDISSGYKVTVTKGGYSSAATYGVVAGNASPVARHLTLAPGAVTNAAFVIDALASFTLRTFSQGEGGLVALPNVSYTLVGTKTIGSTAEGEPLYKTELSRTTGVSGVRTDALEYDTYTLRVSGYDIIAACEVSPFTLTPGSVADVSFTLGPATAHSLLVAVRDHAGVSVPSASVTVSRSGYDETRTASECGSAYFGALSSGTYSITIAAEGYETVTHEQVRVLNQTSYVARFE